MLTTMQRLAKAKELAVIGGIVDMATDIKRQVLLKRRAEGLRAVLLGRRGSEIGDVDIFNPDAVADLIERQLAAMEDQPLYQQARTARYLLIVGKFAWQAGSQSNGPWLRSGPGIDMLVGRLEEISKTAESEGYRAEQFLRFEEAGREAYGFKMAASVAQNRLAEVQAKGSEAGAVRLAALNAEIERRAQITRPLREVAQADFAAAVAYRDEFLTTEATKGITEEERQRREAEYERLRAVRLASRQAYDVEYSRQFDGLVVEPEPDAERAEKEAASQQLVEVGRQFAAAALAASPVTEAEADAWAAKQEIAASARAKMKAARYDVKQARKDMAEFYRLCGGRLSSIKLRSDGKGKTRATAGNVGTHKTGTVNVGAGLDKRVLFHELAHHLETDPLALAAARGFIERRRQGTELHKMRDLTGVKAYKETEVGYKDSWFNPYIGSHYEWYGRIYGTEVMSMGMESFADPETLARRVAADAEHFALMLGFLKTKPDPLFDTVKRVFKQYADAETEAEEAGEAVRAESIKRLTAGVTLERLEPRPGKPYILDDDLDAEYLGSFGTVDVWRTAKKLLRRTVGRKSKTVYQPGIVVGKHSDHAGDERRWRSPWDTKYVFGDMREAIALARAWNEGDGNPDLSTPEAAKQWANRVEAAQAASQP